MTHTHSAHNTSYCVRVCNIQDLPNRHAFSFFHAHTVGKLNAYILCFSEKSAKNEVSHHIPPIENQNGLSFGRLECHREQLRPPIAAFFSLSLFIYTYIYIHVKKKHIALTHRERERERSILLWLSHHHLWIDGPPAARYILWVLAKG